MKKSLLAVVAALAIAGCSQNDLVDEIDNGNQTGKTEMKVTSVISKNSRAAEADLNTLKQNGFILYGYNTESSTIDAASEFDSYMTSVKATHNTDWQLAGGPYYWPINDNLQFFAYSAGDGNVANYQAPTPTNKYPSFEYTVPAVDQQEDLLISHAYNQTKTTNATEGVALDFKHILTQINFKLVGKDDKCKYSITKIELQGINKVGTYTYNADRGAWTTPKTETEYEYSVTYPVTIENRGTATIATESNKLMLLPQDLGTNAKIVVTYSTTDSNDKPIFASGTKSFSLDQTIWEPGKKILYTITLPSGAEPLKVLPTVNDTWSEEDNRPIE